MFAPFFSGARALMSAKASSTSQFPLVVDMDGTLLKTDLLHEQLVTYMARSPLAFLDVLKWLMRGRSHLKGALARHVPVHPAGLPYRESLVKWLRDEKKRGRKI